MQEPVPIFEVRSRYSSPGSSSAQRSLTPVHVFVPSDHDRLFASESLDYRRCISAGGACWIQEGSCDAGPPASFHVFHGRVKVSLQLMQVSAQVPQQAVRGDQIPVCPLDLDDDEHLLALHLDSQVHAAAALPEQPPLALGGSQRLR